MSIKIAINGFGRIGRVSFKKILENNSDVEIVAINDLTDNKTLAHLLKYDSSYGIYNKTVKADDEFLTIDGKEIKCLTEKDPSNLPWKDLEVDVVLECTGYFTDLEGAKKHLEAGAKKVIISAPSKSSEIPHFVLGVNEEKYNSEKDNIVSMCSCTTNCLAPVAKILHQNFEIESGLMTTIHSYTNDQRLLDAPHKDLRRARSAGLSMIPTTTGAAIAVTKAIPELEGKIHGMAIRIPTATVSLVDFVAKVKKDTTVEDVNYIFKKASSEKGLSGILGIEDALLVSIDYKGNSFSSIVDMGSTMVQGKNLIKVLAWYDNEWAYGCRLAEFAEFIGKKL
ncbi:type I glyceraldehyde-3-phosphate dehydrogenase [Patescibacteria group bacterium]|nr:type I glyceraldehyde-3-phosphate dehydrogenase [Patescibacteria group bacterium]